MSTTKSGAGESIQGLATLAGIVAFIGLFRWPYGYYIFLRGIFCLALLVTLVVGLRYRLWFVLVFLGLVALYNPIWMVQLGRGTKWIWFLINAATVFGMWVTGEVINAKNEPTPPA